MHNSFKPDNTMYTGRRNHTGAVVTVDHETLSPDRSFKLRKHSPTGFEWGYGGSGPAQLALALLLDFTGDEEISLRLYHDFKFEKVAGFAPAWSLQGAEIRAWLEALNRPHEIFHQVRWLRPGEIWLDRNAENVSAAIMIAKEKLVSLPTGSRVKVVTYDSAANLETVHFDQIVNEFALKGSGVEAVGKDGE